MKALAALVILLGFAGTAAADPVQFRDEARNISFTYNDNVWRPVAVEGTSVTARIEWRLLGGEFIAECYLDADRGRLAEITEGRVHERVSLITDTFTGSVREHDPDAELLASKTRMVGAQEVIYLRQRFVYSRGPDLAIGVTLDTLYTALKGESIRLECMHPDRPYENSALRTHVEDQIRIVTDSLSFGN
jgi:hypothetical protein